MSRLSATLRLDTRLQARNKVYLVIGVMACGVALLLGSWFGSDDLRFWMPILALGSTTATTVFLVGMLLQFERGEGMLDVVFVSRLRPGDYLASKLLTLSSLALIEGGLLVGIAYRGSIAIPWLAIAVFLRASLGVAVGVAIGVRYGSILRWLLPVVGVSVAFDLPNIWYLGLWPSPLFYLWPTMPSLLIAKAAFLPVEPATLLYAVAYGVLAAGAAVVWALRSIDRFVVRGEYAR